MAKRYRQLTQSQLKNKYGGSASAVRSRLVSVVFDLGAGKVKMPMHKDVAPRLEKACADYRAKIKAGKAKPYKLIAKSCGTFNWRFIRGSSSTMSMHSFGIAVDLNAYCPNGFGYGAKSNIPAELVKSFNAFGIYWGGDWSGGSYDPMHFEYAPDSDFGKVAKPEIIGKVVPSAPAKPKPPAKTAKKTMPEIRIVGTRGAHVKTWQKIVGVKADGVFGEKTKAATKAWQKKKGLTADGIVGAKSWAKAGY